MKVTELFEAAQSINSIIDGFIQREYNANKPKQARAKTVTTIFNRGFRAGFANEVPMDNGVSDKDITLLNFGEKKGKAAAKGVKDIPTMFSATRSGTRKVNGAFDKFVLSYVEQALKDEDVIAMIQKHTDS